MATAAHLRYVTLPIEQLVARGGGEMGDGGGQFVLARDQHDPAGPLVRRRVGRTYERTAHHLRVVSIRDGEGREQTVRVTDEHPFFVAGRDWTKAQNLAAGDQLPGAAGEAMTVISNLGEDHPEGVTVYNLEVEDAHTYFVRGEGSDGEPVWVHNANYDLTSRAEVAAAISKTKSLSEAKQLLRTYRSLLGVLADAEAEFALRGASYLRRKELALIKKEPWRKLMFEGTARDRIFKTFLRDEQRAGRLTSLSITPQGAAGIDVFQGGRLGFDITTRATWVKHAARYDGTYDIMLPLLYR